MLTLTIFLIFASISSLESKSCKKNNNNQLNEMNEITTTVRMRLLADCEEPLTRGTPGPATGIRYFFDPDLDMCFPYLYEGANEGVNSWINKDECENWCIPQDFHSCGGTNEGVGTCGELTMTNCTEGLTCVVGGFGFGFCCDEKDEEDWNNEFTPKCPGGGEPIAQEKWFGPRAILGKSCDHKFCPTGSQCHPQKWMSFCCPQTNKAAVDCGQGRKKKKGKNNNKVSKTKDTNEYKH